MMRHEIIRPSMSAGPCSWLAADRTPPTFVRFSVSPLLFVTRPCGFDGVGGVEGVLTSCSECVEHALDVTLCTFPRGGVEGGCGVGY